MDFSKLENRSNIKFKDSSLLETSFIHRSYLNENKGIKEHNERLEFLGDAVLELIVTEFLFNNYDEPEGDLTNWRSALVKRETLAIVARELSLGGYLKLSKGEESSGGREKDYILANTVEALLGAIYLDQGYDVSKKFVETFIICKLDLILKEGLHIDAKSNFQEESQAVMGITPEYRIINEEGPDHAKIFTVGVYLAGELLGKGEGPNKQTAEQHAAIEGLKKKGWGKYKGL